MTVFQKAALFENSHAAAFDQKKRIETLSSFGYIYKMNTDWTSCDAVERQTGKVSGAWVFKGTRVPVHALFDNIEDGASIDDFLEWFPGVTRCQVEAVLEYASAGLLVGLPA